MVQEQHALMEEIPCASPGAVYNHIMYYIAVSIKGTAFYYVKITGGKNMKTNKEKSIIECVRKSL